MLMIFVFFLFVLGNKLSLSNLFTSSSSKFNAKEVFEELFESSSDSKTTRLPDHVDEHIYEELDSIYTDSDIKNNRSVKSGSFFGNQISRDKILDYLNGARDRLVVNQSDQLLTPFENRKSHLAPSGATEEHLSNVIDSDVNNDSGNSSLCLAEDYSDTLACFLAAKRYKSKSKQSNGLCDNDTPTTNRRNRVSNVSNASSESSATSGVSNMTIDDTEDDGITTSSSSLGSVANSNYYRCNSIATVERNDSGVGNEIAANMKNKLNDCEADTGDREQCRDCLIATTTTAVAAAAAATETEHATADYYSYHNVCGRCVKRRNERKEIISEIVDTELKYGRDLRIILEEFARPISVAGLLTAQQVDDIFLNLDELIDVNCQLADRLQQSLERAVEQGDEVSIRSNL